ncbi:MAG: GAF domain-containing protein [Cytophagales bacterium]|nr:GAF domain-containing protein [Bernardetiaceae bacterium]MDW8203910.1 GAF domain-containing protein [Cytophagales bacterium]
MRLFLSILALSFAVGLLLILYHIGYLAPQQLAEALAMKGSPAQQQEAANQVVRQILIYVSIELVVALILVIALALYIRQTQNANVIYVASAEQNRPTDNNAAQLQASTDDYLLERLTQQIASLVQQAKQSAENNPTQLNQLLSAICHATNAVAGVCFKTNPYSQTIHAIAGFALMQPLPTEAFAYGEGFVGQAAQAGKPIYLHPVPQDYIPVQTGLGKAQPASLLFLPVVANNQTWGVIELAFFQQVSEKLLENLQKNIHLSSPLFANESAQPNA